MNKTLNQWIAQDTSKQSYKFMVKRKIGLQSLYGKIINLLKNEPDGFSIGEISQLLNIQKSTISPRIKELRDLGIIKHLEDRHSFQSGVRNMIWILQQNYEENIELIQ